MKKFFRDPLRISVAVIGGIVDVYSFFQILVQTRFKMPELLNSPWLWLFVIVTLTVTGLFLYFKRLDYKALIASKFEAQKEELNSLKNEFAAYRKAVNEEFGRAYNQITDLNNKANKLHWQLQEERERSNIGHSA